MPIAIPILLAFGLIMLLARSSHADIPGANVNTPSVKAWRTKFLELGPDVPIDAAEAWIAEESEGNPCAIGEEPPAGATQPQEYGIAQLNAKDPTNLAIASPEKLRGNGLCGIGPGQWQKQLRPMTEGEKYAHASAAIQLMRHCASKAREYLGSDSGWGVPDFWRLAKCYHASSAVANLFPAIRKQMGRAPSWSEFQDVAQRVSLAHGYSQKFLDRVFLNSNKVGNALIGKASV
jgi:hypothetical protein